MSNNGQRIAALLPLKGHSSRVPNKNFKMLNGKPLVRWILDTLLSMDEITEVVINTDARDKLAEVGVVEDARVRIRDRHPDICGDDVSMNLVLADDVAAVEADIYLMTHTTNPLLGRQTLLEAISSYQSHLQSGSADSLFSVTRHQTRFYRKDLSPVNHDPDNLIPTQNLEPWFEENSNFYLFTRESFGQTQARIGLRPALQEVPKIEAIDIDTMEDWLLAEAVAKALYPVKGLSQ